MSSTTLSPDQLEAIVKKANEIRDEDKLYKYKGVFYPMTICSEENIKALDNITAREDDVVLVAYPKCGELW